MADFALTIHLGPEDSDEITLDEDSVLGFRIYERLSGMEPTLDLPKSQLHGYAPDDISPDSAFEGGRLHHAPPIMGHDSVVSPPYYFRVLMTPVKLPGGRRLQEVINAPVRLTLTDSANTGERHLRGLVQRVLRRDGPFTRSSAIELQVYPWLWSLSLSEKCRVWQFMSSVDILKQLSGEYAKELADVPVIEDSALSAPPPKRETVIQWHESDFEFISRMLERDGIFYTFSHDESATTLHLRDTRSGFREDAALKRTLTLDSAVGPGSELFDDTVTHLTMQVQSTPRRYRVGDYNPMQAATPLDYGAPAEAASAMEVYDYPGQFDSLGDAPDIARRRFVALEARQEVTTGACRCPFLAAGSAHALPDPLDDEAEAAEVHITQSVHELLRTESGMPVYRNWFEAMAAERGYAPAQRTPIPSIQGTHNAEVVSSLPGETVDVDEHSRALVIFRWDRETKPVRVRLGQPWAGAKHGMHVLPRAGDEVLIGFIQGSTEQPVLMTSVHNSTTPKMFEPTRMMTHGLRDALDPGPERPDRYTTALHNDVGNAIYMNDEFRKEVVKIDAYKDFQIEVGHKEKTQDIKKIATSGDLPAGGPPANSPPDFYFAEDTGTYYEWTPPSGSPPSQTPGSWNPATPDPRISNDTDIQTTTDPSSTGAGRTSGEFQKDPDERGNFHIRSYGNMEIYVGKLTDDFGEQAASSYKNEHGEQLTRDNRGDLNVYVMGKSTRTVHGGLALSRDSKNNLISAQYTSEEETLGLHTTSSISRGYQTGVSTGIGFSVTEGARILGVFGLNNSVNAGGGYSATAGMSVTSSLSPMSVDFKDTRQLSVSSSFFTINSNDGLDSINTDSITIGTDMLGGAEEKAKKIKVGTIAQVYNGLLIAGIATATIVLTILTKNAAETSDYDEAVEKTRGYLKDDLTRLSQASHGLAAISWAVHMLAGLIVTLTRAKNKNLTQKINPSIEMDPKGVKIEIDPTNTLHIDRLGIKVNTKRYDMKSITKIGFSAPIISIKSPKTSIS